MTGGRQNKSRMQPRIPLFDDSNFDFESYLDHRMGERMFDEHEDSLVDDHRPVKSVMTQKQDRRVGSDYLLARKLFVDHRGADVYSGVLKNAPESPICIRVLRMDSKNLKNIARELILLTRCRARSILQYENGVASGDILFLEFPFMQRLSDLIARQVENRGDTSDQAGILSEKLVTKLAFDVLNALKDLQSLGLVHGAVNSDNVLLGTDGQFLLTGLDLAYTHGSGLSIEGCAEIATNMPAEQLGVTKTGSDFYSQHEIEDLHPFAQVGFSYSADIWAVGTLVFHSVLGLPLFGYPTKENVHEFLEIVPFGNIPNINCISQPDGNFYSDLLAEFLGACLHRDFNSRPSATSLLHFPIFADLRLKRYQLRPVKHRLELEVAVHDNANYRPAAQIFKGPWLKALTEGKTYVKPQNWKVETKPKPSKRLTNTQKVRVYVRVRETRKNRIRYLKITRDAQTSIQFDDQEVAEKLLELLTSGLLNQTEYMILLAALQDVFNACIFCRPLIDQPNALRASLSADRLRIWVPFDENRDTKLLIGCAQIVVDQALCTCRRR